VQSLDFEDHPFTVQNFDSPCSLCGAMDSYLDEVILDDKGASMFVCSDSDYCQQRTEAQERTDWDERTESQDLIESQERTE
jgi:alpha-D-ribose 1-methylphosphonate 5-phosphate C-P lyase